MRFNRFFVVFAVVAVAVACSGTLRAAAVIYEPFDDSDSPLNGNTSGLGLTSNWSAGTSWVVTAGSYPAGDLLTSGNRVEIFSGRTSANALVGTTLSDAGLMADGQSLYFSVVMMTNSAFGANPDFGFALGNNNLGGANNIPMSGQGIGVTLKNGQFRATVWDDADANTAAERGTGLGGLSTETPYLLVGEIIWGSGGADDTINLYAPDATLNPGSIVSTFSKDLDQASFDRITFANKADNLPVGIDEIRFGASFADVLPAPSAVPEPSTLAMLVGLGSIGLLGWMRRRRWGE